MAAPQLYHYGHRHQICEGLLRLRRLIHCYNLHKRNERQEGNCSQLECKIDILRPNCCEEASSKKNQTYCCDVQCLVHTVIVGNEIDATLVQIYIFAIVFYICQIVEAKAASVCVLVFLKPKLCALGLYQNKQSTSLHSFYIALAHHPLIWLHAYQENHFLGIPET